MTGQKTQSLETVGRLHLWTMALEHVWHLLGLAERALASSKDPARMKREDAWNERFCRFLEWAHGTSDRPSETDHLAFNQIDPCPFPLTGDCYSLHHSQILLAAVIFCQIYNSGHAHRGAIADNREMTKLLSQIEETMLIESAISRDKFTRLKDQVRFIRDKVLAHADGPVFEISHGEQITSHKTPLSFIHDIDLVMWRQASMGLRNAALQMRIEMR
jgi:hypothetical protein